MTIDREDTARFDSRKQQEVKHAFYKQEKATYKPLAKYVYDDFGSMVNTHRHLKKPTVKKFISKANEDLQN